EYIITFSDYEGQGRYIALMCGSGSSYIYYYVDDLTVEVAPSCAIPKDLKATELTDSQVTLTWTPRGSETAWNVQYKKTADSDWSELFPVSEASCTITGLRRGTVYEARVQANCAADDQSEWTYPVSFTTDCGIWPIDAENDLTQDFASSDFPPMCWNLHKVNNYYGWQYSSGQYNPLDQQGAAYSYWPTGETYMVLPQMHLDGAARLTFDMVFSGDGSGEESSVVLSTTGYEILNFTKTLWTATEFPKSKTTVTVDLSAYDAKDIYIAFKYVGVGTSGRTWYVDNIQVFVADKVFITTGDWDVDDNWMPAGLPQSTHSVRINADATIPANCVAEADKVAIGSGSLTIADGGQLVHNNAEVEATIQKLVTGYGESTGGYALLAFPFSAEVEPSSSMLSETYDLYYYDQAYDMAEWRNYRAEPFTLQSGKGYLYAHDTETTIEVTGMLNPSKNTISTSLSYSSDANPDLIGFNLVGNPFACNAYLADARDYLVLNEAGDGFVTVSGAIAPMEAVMVQASEEGSLVFTTTEPDKQAKIELSVWQQQSMVDNARIRFGEGHTLNKLSLRDDATCLSIQQDGRDYAVACADSHDEMPIAFKARRNGTYTLNVNAEGVSTRYLHLVDHLTGADVDLLKNPSYTFEAKTNDYRSRFSLVFMVGDADSDEFAFMSDGRLIVANDGEAFLEVIDAAGRVISSHSLNGNSSELGINTAAGVYVLRLVNGNTVKTQKIIIE
nr:choice-of-anchor J domain-containing protein [Bacteroidales bacterium]